MIPQSHVKTIFMEIQNIYYFHSSYIAEVEFIVNEQKYENLPDIFQHFVI